MRTRPRPTRRRAAAAVLVLGAACALAACGGDQSVTRPASEPARSVATLWWVMLGVACAGMALIAFLLALGWLRRRRPGLPLGLGDRTATTLIVLLGIVAPIVSLPVLFSYGDFVVLAKTDAPTARSSTLTIHVIGHQWFWEVRYPGTTAVTANEIHIPVRTRVRVLATTADVIHSFWVPELNRKIDMIPGRENHVFIEADRPGVYRGQCAEFCGLQHAHMALAVYAQPAAQFRAWLANMAAPARRPSTPREQRGERVFLDHACASCHTIRGTPANGAIGPDLTHLRSRATLAALTIPNRLGYLGGWILDPQHVKPGNKMPGLNLSGPVFRDLLVYLESLR